MIEEIKAKLRAIVKEKLERYKEHIVVELSEARTRIIRARVRGGKIQRRKRVSNVKGYTIRGGKLTRMSSSERLHRKRAAKRAKIKRRAKMARALIKRRRSLRKRKSLGL